MTPPDAEKPLSAEEIAALEKLRAAGTQGEWMQAFHIGVPTALVSSAAPSTSLLAIHSDDENEGLAVVDRADDAALMVAAVNALPRLLTTARSANLAYARGREEGLEAAAKWHEDRADRVERESPGLGNFLSDTDREYIAKRAAADREDATSIRALKDAPQGETRREHKDHEGRK